MSSAHTPISVSVTSLVPEILLPSKTTKFPFLTMDYSPWSSKNSMDRNQLKKFMQVGIDVKCMHTNFGGCDLSGFGDTATFKTAKFPFLTMDYSPWTIVHGHQKIQWIGIGSKNSGSYKLMSNACTPILVGVTSPVSEILLPSKTAKFPFPTMDYSPWSSKNSMDRNQLKKFMQAGIDVKCMRTNFGGCGLLGFGDTATFKTAKFPFLTMDYSPWSSKYSIDRNWSQIIQAVMN